MSLSRRVRTLIVAGIVFVVLFALALTMPVPYVILAPGPTYNTLGTDSAGHPIIGIVGKKPAATSGHLNLTTVSVSGGSVTAVQALTAWLRHDEVVVPRAAVFPPGRSEQETNRQNTEDFITSQDDATAAALCYLRYPRGFGVLRVAEDGPSHGILEPGDFLDTVDGKPANSAQLLMKALESERPGKTVTVRVTRGGKPVDVQIRLGPPVKGRSGASLGVVVTTGCLAPYTIDLGLGNQIGGPSAGLMFALGIIEKAGGVNVTGGRFIAGTGTIDRTGKVGEIGGIQLKMIAARRKGATVFLAPASNCGEVHGATPSGLQVVKVTTLTDAVQDLMRIEHHQSVPSC